MTRSTFAPLMLLAVQFAAAWSLLAMLWGLVARMVERGSGGLL